VTELLSIDLRDAQAGISELYVDLDRMKGALAAEGYRDRVDEYASKNELAGANTPPSSIGFFYERPGVIQFLYMYSLATDPLTHSSVSVIQVDDMMSLFRRSAVA
jgi:hypothetical protein